MPIHHHMMEMIILLNAMQTMIVKEKYVATNVAVNIVSRIHMLRDMRTVKSRMFGMEALIITLDAI